MAHGCHDAAQIVDCKAFLKNHPNAQIKRLGSAHRQVVDRAIDGKRADVPAGKEKRPHHISVGRKGKPHSGNVEHGAVMNEIIGRLRRRRDETRRRCRRRVISPPPPWASSMQSPICPVLDSSA